VIGLLICSLQLVFKIAGYDVCNVNNFCPQTHVLKKRLGYVSEDFNGLVYSRDGYDADFSRRLGRTSIDGVYHKDGVRDCSNANEPDTILPRMNPGQNGASRELKDQSGTAVNHDAERAVAVSRPGGGQNLVVTSADANNRIVYNQSGILVGDLITLGNATGGFFCAGYVGSIPTATHILHVIPTIFVEGETAANFNDTEQILTIQAPNVQGNLIHELARSQARKRHVPAACRDL